MLRTISFLKNSRPLPRTFVKPTYVAQTSRSFRTSIPRPKIYIRFSDSPPNPRGGPSRQKSPLDYKRWDTRTRYLVAIVGIGGLYYVSHLEQVPETGRWRFMNTSSKAEAQVGRDTAMALKAELGNKILPPNHPYTLYVRRIASRLLKQSNLGHIKGETPSIPLNLNDEFWAPSDDYGSAAKHTYGSDVEWEVVVVNDSKVINAMATPGMILVFTGILPVCQDEEGLAAVIAHEIGHVVARHIAERMSSQTVQMVGLLLFQALLGVDFGISNTLRTILLDLPNSRTQELEADVVGLKLMARACYNPAAAPRMFERLGKASPGFNIDFLSTHPTSRRRVEQLDEALPEAYAILAANPECSNIKEQYDQFRDHAVGSRRIEFL